MALTLEEILTDAHYAGLDASPLQRAICRAADGRPLAGVISDEEAHAHFGCSLSEVEAARRPTIVVLPMGVRSAKSTLAAAKATQATLTINLDAVPTRELPRLTIVAPHVDNAEATFRILRGMWAESPILRDMVESTTTDSMIVRRPDGREIELCVVAAHRGGLSLRSRWLVGAVLEEVAFFPDEVNGSAINAEEMLRSTETRLLPGAQVWIISSPMGPRGLLYDLYRAHFGKPDRVLVVHAPTEKMNPAIDREMIAAVRLRDPDAAAREFDAAWIDATSSFFEGVTLDRNQRKTPLVLSPQECAGWVAAMDPATRGNAWTLVVVGVDKRDGANAWRVGLARQWIGSKVQPLSPGMVFKEIRRLVEPYGCGTKRVPVWTDQWAFDSNVELAARCGLAIAQRSLSTPERTRAYENIRAALQSNRLDLPPDPVVRNDLRGVTKVVGSSGPTVKLAKTADGRHCDYAASLSLLFAQPPDIIAHERRRKVDRYYTLLREYVDGGPDAVREFKQREVERDRMNALREEARRRGLEEGHPEASEASASNWLRRKFAA